jgi:hypothetical protein
MSNFSKKMQERMQEKLQKIQEEIKQIEVVGKSANDFVQVTLTGEQKVKKVAVSKEVVNPNDIEALEDLIHVAIDDALHKLQEETRNKLPGLGNLGM